MISKLRNEEQMSNNFPSLCGKFLIAMPGMADARFERAVIYVCAHTDEGAMGFIINKIMDSLEVTDFLEQLEIISGEERIEVTDHLLGQVMHVGGPVEPGRGFVLHTSEFESETTLEVSKTVRLTATLEILRAIAVGKGPAHSILALGYSGWGAGQLESEIAANGWLTVDCDDEILFDLNNDSKYEKSLSLLGVDPSLLSYDAGRA